MDRRALPALARSQGRRGLKRRGQPAARDAEAWHTVASVIIKWYGDNMIRTQISFDAKLYARAKIVARRQGISLAELCRRCLQTAIAADAGDKPWMKYAGIVDGEPEDSATVDDVVYGRDRP